MLLVKRVAKKVLKLLGLAKKPAPLCPNPEFDPLRHAERVKKWQENDSDIKFRTNYPGLTPQSILLDLGGFHGEFALFMNAKYGCECHVFEVIPELCERIQKDITNRPRISLHPFGLAGKDSTETLYLANEGSSVHSHRGNQGVPLKSS
ncbi:MAG: hypothetical protein EXR99_12705 [Gemmataceae bacterium]|nr:hypothetical protein [Gemmataceae bacterium]